METLEELKRYIEDECFRQGSIDVGKLNHDQSHMVWEENGRYYYGYSERGNVDIYSEFDTEKEAVNYVYDSIKDNKSLKLQIAAWLWDEESLLAAQKELEAMNIEYERNDIPYYSDEHKHIYRLFVFGKDILKLDDFKNRYFYPCWRRTR